MTPEPKRRAQWTRAAAAKRYATAVQLANHAGAAANALREYIRIHEVGDPTTSPDAAKLARLFKTGATRLRQAAAVLAQGEQP